MSEAEALLKEALSHVGVHIEYLHTGSLPQAIKEYVEALTFYKLHKEGDIPNLSELNFPIEPLVQGLMEVFGECRRVVVNALRMDELDRAERWFKTMEILYNSLRGVELYRGVLPNVKYRMDEARGVIEATRSSVALAAQYGRLRQALRMFKEVFRG